MDNSKRLDIVNLINNSPLTTLSNNFQSTLLKKIQGSFIDEDQRIFVASFYSYLNYNSKTDFVIDLDDVWKWCGFTRKDHCKRTLEKHFTVDVDYKKLLPRIGEQVYETTKDTHSNKKLGGAGLNKETVLMNIETFKSLCMLAGTSKSKQIRQYYLKLEQLLQDTLQEQLREQERLLQEQTQRLQERERQLEELENKPETIGFLTRRAGYNYIIKDVSRQGHYKVGFAENTKARLSALNTSSSTHSLEIIFRIFSKDKELSERMIHNVLEPFRIKNNNQRLNEWFYLKNETELAFAVKSLKECINFIDKYIFQDQTSFKTDETIIQLNLESELSNLTNNDNFFTDDVNKGILNNYITKQNEIVTFRGVSWIEEKKKWRAEFQYDKKRRFLGHFIDQIDAAKAYNDYALFLNQTENANLILNEIPGYITVARNIPEINRLKITDNKTSQYNGVSYDSKRKFYVAGIKFAKKTYNLGNGDEIECAKLYNQQASYFNNTFGTTYILNQIPDYITVPNDIRDQLNTHKKTSKYYGVSLTKTNKWACSYVLNRKKIHIGTFDTELEACQAYNNKVIELNKNSCNYKVNDI
jgi:phage anti-repressor protein